MNIKTILYHFIINPNKRKKLRACGNDVSIEPGVNMNWNNVEIGNDVSIGTDCLFMCSGAPIHIGSHVMFGPRVTVITGDHRIDIPGKYMTEIKGTDKLPENDLPVVFEGDNWIGANSTILKGVTVGKGAVIAAGALVTKDVPPYSIVAGVPAKKINDRFSESNLTLHVKLMNEREK